MEYIKSVPLQPDSPDGIVSFCSQYTPKLNESYE